jgi:hypothetical protein
MSVILQFIHNIQLLAVFYYVHVVPIVKMSNSYPEWHSHVGAFN